MVPIFTHHNMKKEKFSATTLREWLKVFKKLYYIAYYIHYNTLNSFY